MSGTSDGEDTTLLGAGTWTKQGPATLVLRENAWVVLVPGLRKQVIEAAWTVLGERPAPEDFLDRLVDVGELGSADRLTALLFGFHDGPRGVFGVKGKTPIAVYTEEGAQQIAGSDDEPFVLRTLEGVRRTAFGELPLEDGLGAPRLEAGIVPVRGFVHVTVDPAELEESARAALAEQVTKDGRSIEDPEVTKRRAERPAPAPASTAASAAAGPAAGTPAAASSTASGSGAGATAPAAGSTAPTPESSAPNMFDGLFAGGSSASRAAAPAAASTSAQTPAAATSDAPAAGASTGASTGADPAPPSASRRRRLVSSSLFDRTRRSAAEEMPPAAPAPGPPVTVPTPVPPEAGDTQRARRSAAAEFVSPDTQVAPVDAENEREDRPTPAPRRAPAPRQHPAPRASTSAPAGSELENTGAYDDLFGKTVFRRIEDAAVRRAGDEDGDEGAESAATGPELAEASPEASAPRPDPGPEAVVAPAPEPEPDSAPSEFIDWVPGVGRTAPEIAQTAARRAVAPSAPEPAYPQVHMAERPPAPDTGSRPSPTPPSMPAPDPVPGRFGGSPNPPRPTQPGAAAPPPRQAPVPPTESSGPTAGSAVALPGLVCAHGHPNSPERAACRTCGAPLQGATRTVARPPLGVVMISGGARFVLDRTAIVGRRPRASRVSANDVPQLVTVPSPQQDISRSHLELRLEGWHVVALDLGTTNGTTLHRAGFEPVRLRPRDGVVLYDGDLLDLGDGVQLTFGERV
ncbi:FHA domain-containing protein [Brachybacterium vulturis]|uniref:FHA domain-containing protein n=1 Tax=Brachybacterium vulturis TaxID=2017484 RepID=UPI00373596F6